MAKKSTKKSRKKAVSPKAAEKKAEKLAKEQEALSSAEKEAAKKERRARLFRDGLPAIALVAAWGEFIYYRHEISIYWGIALVFITSGFMVLLKERYFPTKDD